MNDLYCSPGGLETISCDFLRLACQVRDCVDLVEGHFRTFNRQHSYDVLRRFTLSTLSRHLPRCLVIPTSLCVKLYELLFSSLHLVSDKAFQMPTMNPFQDVELQVQSGGVNLQFYDAVDEADATVDGTRTRNHYVEATSVSILAGSAESNLRARSFPVP